MSDNEGEEIQAEESAAASSDKPEPLKFDDADLEIHTGEAGASKTEPRQCSSLKKNGFVVMKNRPCKIVEMSTSKTGKHGHAKVHLVGIDIFTGKKYEDMCPSSHNMDAPYVSRREFTLMNISNEGFLEMMSADSAGLTKEDVRLPEGDLGSEIKTRFENGDELIVTVIAAMGEEAVVAYRNSVDNKK
jgi:translation initiation factor 5A